jgi:hypothetical protein
LFYGDLTEIYGEKKTGNYQKERNGKRKGENGNLLQDLTSGESVALIRVKEEHFRRGKLQENGKSKTNVCKGRKL